MRSVFSLCFVYVCLLVCAGCEDASTDGKTEYMSRRYVGGSDTSRDYYVVELPYGGKSHVFLEYGEHLYKIGEYDLPK